MQARKSSGTSSMAGWTSGFIWSASNSNGPRLGGFRDSPSVLFIVSELEIYSV